MQTMDAFSVVTFRGFQFLIARNPTSTTMEGYIKELKRYNVKTLIRVCEPTYSTTPLKESGIEVLDLTIPDGTFPSEKILEVFFDVLRRQYERDPHSCVAMHCVSGLGRAPVMVAVALIELGFPYEDAVELIREKRRGAINAKQLEFLSKYKPRHKLATDRKKSCILQ